MSVDRGYPRAQNGKLHGQDFAELKTQYLSSGDLFEDPYFRPEISSLNFNDEKDYGEVEWWRPSELLEKKESSSDPKFIVGGKSRFDVNQGSCGNCGFMSALANIACSGSMLDRVVPDDQSFDEGDYAGIFHFRFWQYGEWIDVVVDDYLPCYSWGHPKFVASKTGNEFWQSLLEKAYAKLHGSYQLLTGFSPKDAMVDLTGGMGVSYPKGKTPEHLYDFLDGIISKNRALAVCWNTKSGDDRDGVINNHAYSITKVLHTRYGKLIRLRNPHGKSEWTGDWSDGSDEWNSISEDEKEEIGLNFDDKDGEFWMNILDFPNYFESIDLCDYMSAYRHEKWGGTGSSRNQVRDFYHGSWDPAEGTAGGCTNYRRSTYCNNPQYRFKVHFKNSLAIISLMQKYRTQLTDDGEEFRSIGFDVYSLGPDPNDHPNPLDKNFFRFGKGENVGGASYLNSREVTARIPLNMGTYAIVPTTFEQDQDAEFFLRIYVF